MALDEDLILQMLPYEMLSEVLNKVQPLSEMVHLRQVCKTFDETVLGILAKTRILEVNFISRRVTRSLLPRMPNLEIIPKTAIDPRLWRPRNYFWTGKYLARDCPNLVFFHDATPRLIESYARYLNDRLAVTQVRADDESIYSESLVTLVRKHAAVNVFADEISIDKFIKDTPEWPGRDAISHRIVAIKSPQLLSLMIAYFAPELNSVRDMLRMTTRLVCLDIILPMEHAGVIPRYAPQVKHLRLKDRTPLESAHVETFLLFIANHVNGYDTFGLEMYSSENTNDEQQIVAQIWAAGARFRYGPEEMRGTFLSVGNWCVEVDLLNNRYLTKIVLWHPERVQWLYELFPPRRDRTISLVACSPQARNGPFPHHTISEFLEPLANTRALNIEIAADYVDLIPQYCRRLQYLHLHIVKRNDSVNYDAFYNFVTDHVANYESFSLSIEKPMDDQVAFNIVSHLVNVGAQFRYSEQLGHPFISLGSNWDVTFCKFLCIRMWPIERIDFFILLFRPERKIHIRSCRPGTCEADQWKFRDYFVMNDLIRRSVTFARHLDGCN